MGTRIYHTILRIFMCQIVTVLCVIKGKLQHLHPRKSRILYQLFHRRRQESQILCNNVQPAKVALQGPEKLQSRPLLPVSSLRGLISCRNRPVLIKAPEVIHPDHIIQPEAILHPPDPPAVPGLLMIVPPVQRIPPQLSGCRKCIRRTSCHRLRTAILVKLEQLRTGPAVCPVKCHIDRDISQNPNPPSVRISFQLLPLTFKQVLLELIKKDLIL